MENLKKNQQIPKTWVEKFFDYLESILKKYMQKFKDYERLSTFMNDESNLYNEDGSLTQEYKLWIKKFELYCMETPVDKTIESMHTGANSRLEFLKDVKDYLTYRQQLKDKYTKSDSEKEWLDDVFDSPDKREVFEKIVNQELEQELEKLNADNR